MGLMRFPFDKNKQTNLLKILFNTLQWTQAMLWMSCMVLFW